MICLFNAILKHNSRSGDAIFFNYSLKPFFFSFPTELLQYKYLQRQYHLNSKIYAFLSEERNEADEVVKHEVYM